MSLLKDTKRHEHLSSFHNNKHLSSPEPSDDLLPEFPKYPSIFIIITFLYPLLPYFGKKSPDYESVFRFDSTQSFFST